ncbi:MAG: putative bifunctional diguanylate cyclase/phosphodiesterase [Rubripirellula sp.]
MTTEKKQRRILIVDDQQQIHDTFDRVFAIQGPKDDALMDFESRFLNGDVEPDNVDVDGMPSYELDHALSGEEAVELVQKSVAEGTAYSVAFVDMRMPCGMDGMETTEALWEIDPNLHVVICTAYSDHVWEDVLKRLGYSDRLLLLKKPFESDEARQIALALSEKSRLGVIQQQKVDDLGREVERRRVAEETMRDMAHRDALTSLPNRPYLLEKLARIVGTASGKDQPIAVLFLDLDNFKIINDSLGHDAGDDLLIQVASRLKNCVRECDTTSRSIENEEMGETVRLGGDEFVVLLESLLHPNDAISVAKRIVKKIGEPFQLGDRFVTVGTSVGVAFLGSHVKDANEALRNADTAMYRAKNNGKGRVAVFDQTMHDDVVARMELEDQLRRAVRTEAFTLNYQPILDLRTGDIRGVETLIRWTDESGNRMSPSDFIPMIEEIGLIHQVGEWVLENAMRDMMRLTPVLSEAQQGLYLGVNVSGRQLSDPFFLEQLETILARTGFDRRRLKIEMNESVESRGHERVLSTMLDLHRSGVRIQIDDFGKGQSSLNCFQTYPIEAVKIDRSFTASIAIEHSHAAITEAIVKLAHNLNAKIVAEGVESPDQLEVLRRWGCDLAQGYFFSPPLTAQALGRLLKDPQQSKGIKLLQPTPIAPLSNLAGPSSPHMDAAL